MNDCVTLQNIVYLIQSGMSVDEAVPYDLSGASPECIIEICALYIKYGENEDRKKICRRMMDDAARTNSGI